jgi:hypothetical protein
MKVLLSIVLVAGIYLSYLFIEKQVGREVSGPAGGLEFNEYSASLKKLDSVREYEAIATRPLFDEDRIEDKQEVKKAPKAVPRRVVDSLKVQALGVALSSDGILAVIKDLKTGRTVRLRIDDELYGWKLTSVADNKFTFSKQGKERVVQFKNDRGS